MYRAAPTGVRTFPARVRRRLVTAGTIYSPGFTVHTPRDVINGCRLWSCCRDRRSGRGTCRPVGRAAERLPSFVTVTAARRRLAAGHHSAVRRRVMVDVI